MIQAAIFDHDGVIVETEELQRKVWQQFFEQHGISIDKQNWVKEVQGRSAKDVIRLFFKTTDENQIHELAAKRREMFFAEYKDNVIAVSGVVSFLKKLKKEKISIAIASSSYRANVEHTLTTLGLEGVVDEIVTHEDVAISKPHPDVFLKAAERLHFAPANCVVFEDALYGVRAAQAAGMKVVFVQTSFAADEIPEPKPDFAIDRFDDLDADFLSRF